MADVSVLAEAHIRRVAGLVMARLRRPEGTNVQGGNSLNGSFQGQKRIALQKRLTQVGGGGVTAFLQHFDGTWDARCGELVLAHLGEFKHRGTLQVVPDTICPWTLH